MTIKWFKELGVNDTLVAGAKAAYLADLFNNNFPVGNGFVIPCDAFFEFLSSNGIDSFIFNELKSLDFKNLENVRNISSEIMSKILQEDISPQLRAEIMEGYENLDVDSDLLRAGGDVLNLIKSGRSNAIVSVRSSLVYDTPGINVNMLNVVGGVNLVNAVKNCWAGLFSVASLIMNKGKIFDENFSNAVVIQKMNDTSKSGVVLSSNSLNRNKEILVEASFGLGQLIMKGEVNPDFYLIDGNLNIISERVGKKKYSLIRDVNNNETVKKKIFEEDQMKRVLENFEIDNVVKVSEEIEKHYGKPVVVEFGIGKKLEIFHVRTLNLPEIIEREHLSGEVVLEGWSNNPCIASGVVNDDILVANNCNERLIEDLYKIKGVVLNEGGINSCLGILCLKNKIPMIIFEDATAMLNSGLQVTLDGRNGRIYLGEAKRKLDILE